MTADRWAHLKGVLQAVWELDSAERSSFLDEVCGGDAVFRADVEALLASDQNACDFLEFDETRDAWPGRNVGPYRIVREIGHGGMGTVYLAERADGQYEKQVAIKLVNSGAGDSSFLRRFVRERQVLAGLDHPNVVRLLDGGATGSGLPYLVLEYVEGVRIDTWCASHNLSTRDRLRLFRNVCEAVEYAHQKGVIHLDIKPGNILVTAEGMPKLLDFGIARVLALGPLAETTETAPGPRPMTPEYASPEQARGEAVGPATDVYALGLVLHKVLTGRLPGVSAAGSQLDGDLHCILLKAASQTAGERYSSAAAFSEDLERYLQDRPVLARKGSLGYRGRKLVMRNRLTVSLAAALFAGAIVVLAVSRAHAPVPRPIVEVRLPPPLPPAAPVPAPEPAATVKSLVVVQIENQAQQAVGEKMGRGLCDLLTMRLANASGIHVISADRVRELAGRRTQGDGPLSADQVRDVARDAHADLFLSGALTEAGPRVRLRFRIQDTRSGRTLHSDNVEGSDSQAIFRIVDRASARILARLAPGDSLTKSNAGAPLTANLEALKAYEEGLDSRIRFRPVQARKALQHAIELDPQFVMAHYHLADAMRFDGQVTEARRVVARAVQLAQHSATPRLQRLLAEALQMRLDSRMDDAGRILEAAHREFPQEVDPIYQLAVIRGACARFGESAALLEEVVRLDASHPLAHDQLGYQYGFLGNVDRAIAAVDRYAALLPPKNEVPYCTRGDVYMINGRYREALAQYREINYTIPMVVAALHGGEYQLAESLLQGRRQGGNQSSGVLGDLAAARGRLDGAAPLYESAASKYQTAGTLRPWLALLSAARIYLEQGRPDMVLELGRRNDHPWAGGLRATAHLLMHQDAEAEKEFTSLRASISPLLGDTIADGTVEFHRMLAASYSGRHDRVLATWSRLPKSWWSLYALDVGRAYLQAGMFAEAEHHLGLARKAQQAYFMNGDMQAQHNFLTWMLAEFYLAQVMEKTGRRVEAAAYYQDFAGHFENSGAALPQLATARAVLAGLRPSDRGKLIFRDEFGGDGPEGGDWQLADASSKAARDSDWKMRRRVAFHDAIFELSFRIDGAGTINFGFGSEKGAAANLEFDSKRINLWGVEPDEAGVLKLRRLDRYQMALEPGIWHKAVLEVHGKRILAQFDGSVTITGESPALDIDKVRLGLSVGQGGAALRSVEMYEVAPAAR